ncbi:hypothetical protein [Pseudomonas sp.]|uniref:hypothetical protein n=1 Tax=Pseudomonas sp. TaxID=306 RepID=UPI0028A26CA2|nr:hypothetical protein [Pseudomonas sp.]
MFDVDELIYEVGRTEFFSKLGCATDLKSGVIYVESIFKVFVEPVESDFEGCYKDLEWLPTSPTQQDPFNVFPKPRKELVDSRLRVSKAVMQSIKSVPKYKFVCGSHDFSIAARNAACFAFRQYVSESYYGDKCVWSKVIDLYFSGRWPVGYSRDRIIAI